MESVDQRKILNLHGQQHRSRIVLETEHKQVYPDRRRDPVEIAAIDSPISL
ncbi:hypothetical protein JJD41_16155 [Oxynema sp. CENA135]|nr:hypothetical protein [Oxynema sp. CENA135]